MSTSALAALRTLSSTEQLQLQQLELSMVDLTEGDVRLAATVLVSTIHLTHLALTYVGIDDAAAGELADALRSNASLQTLQLTGNQIGPAGAGRIAAALVDHASMRTLSLQGNRIGVAGAVYLADALAAGAPLTTLEVMGCWCDNDDDDMAIVAARLAEGVCSSGSRLTALLVGQHRMASETMRQLGAVSGRLHHLDLFGCTGVDGVGMAHLRAGGLQRLDLTLSEVDGAGLEELAKAVAESTTMQRLELEAVEMEAASRRRLEAAVEENASLVETTGLPGVEAQLARNRRGYERVAAAVRCWLCLCTYRRVGGLDVHVGRLIGRQVQATRGQRCWIGRRCEEVHQEGRACTTAGRE